MPKLDFWYEFASTYSYPAAMRIEAAANAAGVDIRWRPFLLGPIFKAYGWTDSPFNIFVAKGRYMWRDLTRTTPSKRTTAMRLRYAPFSMGLAWMPTRLLWQRTAPRSKKG